MTKRKTSPKKTEAVTALKTTLRADTASKTINNLKTRDIKAEDSRIKEIKTKDIKAKETKIKDTKAKSAKTKEEVIKAAKAETKLKVKSKLSPKAAVTAVNDGKAKKPKITPEINVATAPLKTNGNAKGRKAEKSSTEAKKGNDKTSASSGKPKVPVQKAGIPVPALHRPEQPEFKLDAWFMEISSLNKSQVDPRGTMLVVRDKQHEIGIHVDQTNRNILFSYFPKLGKGQVLNVPVSLHELIRFITHK